MPIPNPYQSLPPAATEDNPSYSEQPHRPMYPVLAYGVATESHPATSYPILTYDFASVTQAISYPTYDLATAPQAPSYPILAYDFASALQTANYPIVAYDVASAPQDHSNQILADDMATATQATSYPILVYSNATTSHSPSFATQVYNDASSSYTYGNYTMLPLSRVVTFPKIKVLPLLSPDIQNQIRTLHMKKNFIVVHGENPSPSSRYVEVFVGHRNQSLSLKLHMIAILMYFQELGIRLDCLGEFVIHTKNNEGNSFHIRVIAALFEILLSMDNRLIVIADTNNKIFQVLLAAQAITPTLKDALRNSSRCQDLNLQVLIVRNGGSPNRHNKYVVNRPNFFWECSPDRNPRVSFQPQNNSHHAGLRS
jgi:hypothetical protein